MEKADASVRSAIEATIRDYIEGWYEGDASRMDRALHDDLAKRMPTADGETTPLRLRSVTKARMLELTTSGGGRTPGAAYEIVVHHVSDGMASARLHSNEYLDYLQLVETTAGWRIANILFRPRRRDVAP